MGAKGEEPVEVGYKERRSGLVICIPSVAKGACCSDCQLEFTPRAPRGEGGAEGRVDF